jgi:hypothetical protein
MISDYQPPDIGGTYGPIMRAKKPAFYLPALHIGFIPALMNAVAVEGGGLPVVRLVMTAVGGKESLPAFMLDFFTAGAGSAVAAHQVTYYGHQRYACSHCDQADIPCSLLHLYISLIS